jgi:tetratricopeptide (TPR) repeat protein
VLKGVPRPVPAWRLVRLLPVEARHAPHPDQPLVGRNGELRQLSRSLDECVRERRFHLAVLHGEPGVGKSRVASEFAARAADDGVLVGVGRCRPYGDGTPLHAFGAGMRQVVEGARGCGLLGPGSGVDFTEALGYLESGLLRDGSPGELPGQLDWAAAEVLRAIGRSRPVLLVLDELQAARPALVRLLAQVARSVNGAAVLVVGAGRSDALDEPPPWSAGLPAGSFLPLGPLGPEDARILVAGMSEVTPHQSGLIEQIVERGDGNPFFLEQLAALAGRGVEQMPPTVRSVIAARLDLLQPIEYDVLLRATVPGTRFSVSELSVLLVADPAVANPASHALDALAGRRLIIAEDVAAGAREEEEAGAYRFCGVLTREVAYNTLPKRARLRYHEALASWHSWQTHSQDLAGLHLERAYRLSAELYPADPSVRHLRITAARVLAAAGGSALRRSDLHWAGDLLAQALDLHDDDSPERLVVGVQLAEARLLLGTDPHAQQTLRSLAEQASAAGDQLTAAHAFLLLAALELPGPSAADDALATIPLFETAGDQLGLTRAWLRVAQVRQLAGRYEEAEGLLRKALRHAGESGAEFELATVMGGLGTSLWRGPVRADIGIDQCNRLVGQYGAGRRTVRAAVSCPHAVLLAYRGDHDEARALVRGASRIISELGHAYGAAATAIFAAAVEGLAGCWDAAEELLRGAAEASGSRGDTLAHAAATAGLARALLEQGRDDAAQDVAAATTLTGDPFLDADTFGVQARVLAGRGHGSEAWQVIERARDAARATDSTAAMATAELDRAHVLRAAGDHAAAVPAATTAGRLFQSKGHLVGVGWTVPLGAPHLEGDVP